MAMLNNQRVFFVDKQFLFIVVKLTACFSIPSRYSLGNTSSQPHLCCVPVHMLHVAWEVGSCPRNEAPLGEVAAAFLQHFWFLEHFRRCQRTCWDPKMTYSFFVLLFFCATQSTWTHPLWPFRLGQWWWTSGWNGQLPFQTYPYLGIKVPAGLKYFETRLVFLTKILAACFYPPFNQHG